MSETREHYGNQPAITRAWACPDCDRLFWAWANLWIGNQAKYSEEMPAETKTAWEAYIAHRMECKVK